jgi:polysaccharide biosynthesis transport protein
MEEYAPELRDRIRMLWRHQLMIVGTAGVAALAALVYSLGQSKTYQAESELVVRPILPQAAFASSGLATAEGGPLGLDASVDTQAEVVRSGSVAKRVAQSLGISTPPEVLSDSVTVEPVTNEVLRITATALTPRLASRLANAFANEYLAYRRDSAANSVEAVAQDLSGRIEGLESTVEELDSTIVSLAVQIADVPAGDVGTRAALQAEVERNRTERNELLIQLGPLRARYLELSFASETASVGGGDVIQRASVPTAPASPHPLRDGALGLMLGSVLGVGFLWLRNHFDPRILTKDEAAQAAGAPVLASVPRSNGWRELVGTDRSPRDVDGRLQEHGQTGGAPLSAPGSLDSEGYRTLRSNLLAYGLGTEVKRLLVVSAQRGEGASTAVANLAVACANAGLRTMAVSADFHHPGMPSLLGIPAGGMGLAEVLTGEASLHEAVAKTQVANLVVLPPGGSKTTAIDLLAFSPLGKVLERAARLVDVVLIEAPSLSLGADTTTLAGHTDRTLLVVRVQVARPGAVARATSLLEQAGSPVLGLLLHDAFRDDDTPGIIQNHLLGGAPRVATRSENGQAPDLDRPSGPEVEPKPAPGQVVAQPPRQGGGSGRSDTRVKRPIRKGAGTKTIPESEPGSRSKTERHGEAPPARGPGEARRTRGLYLPLSKPEPEPRPETPPPAGREVDRPTKGGDGPSRSIPREGSPIRKGEETRPLGEGPPASRSEESDDAPGGPQASDDRRAPGPDPLPKPEPRPESARAIDRPAQNSGGPRSDGKVKRRPAPRGDETKAVADRDPVSRPVEER